LTLAERTDGACDPTVGPLVELWGFGPAGRRSSVPSDAHIEAVMARTGWHRLQRDTEGRLLQPGGVGIDLCGIAKGFGVDRVVDVLADAGIRHCLVEVGGELRARGQRPNGQPWRVAVEAPQAGSGQAAVLALHDMAVATSGDRWHFFEHDGQRHSHTLDPRTGRPVRHGLASVTVLHAECMQADALATALTVLGPVDGMRHAQRHGLAAMFVRRTAEGALERQMSEAFEAAMVERSASSTDSGNSNSNSNSNSNKGPGMPPRASGDRS
ncbi:MAG: apbE family protein, partial [Rhizobacter sp.]|nr:apbE family protein [Rhizobacter sp.]